MLERKRNLRLLKQTAIYTVQYHSLEKKQKVQTYAEHIQRGGERDPLAAVTLKLPSLGMFILILLKLVPQIPNQKGLFSLFLCKPLFGFDEGGKFILFLLEPPLQIPFRLFPHNLFFGLDGGKLFRNPSEKSKIHSFCEG